MNTALMAMLTSVIGEELTAAMTAAQDGSEATFLLPCRRGNLGLAALPG